MVSDLEEKNKALVLRAFDTLFNKGDYATAEKLTIVAEGNFVIVRGRFSGFGAPANWIAADILRIEDGLLVEH
jgi:predicted SnoaL-like aldol condensation-catalyzing enzyme